MNAVQCSINTIVLGHVYLLRNSVVVIQASKRVTATHLPVLTNITDYIICAP